MSESSHSCTVCVGTGVVTDWTGSGQWREDTFYLFHYNSTNHKNMAVLAGLCQ